MLWFVVAFSNCFTIVGNSSYKNKIISNAVSDVLGVYKEIAEDSQLRVEEFFTKYFTLYALILSVQGYYRDDREFEKELSEVFVENKNELESAIKNNMKKIQAAPFIKNIGAWNTCYFSIRMPVLKGADDRISVYVYNQHKQNIQLDNLVIKVENGNQNLYGPRKDQYLFADN